MEETNKYSASCKQKDANAGDLTHNLLVMVMMMDTNTENTTEDTIHKHNVINDWFTSVTQVLCFIYGLWVRRNQCQSMRINVRVLCVQI